MNARALQVLIRLSEFRLESERSRLAEAREAEIAVQRRRDDADRRWREGVTRVRDEFTAAGWQRRGTFVAETAGQRENETRLLALQRRATEEQQQRTLAAKRQTDTYERLRTRLRERAELALAAAERREHDDLAQFRHAAEQARRRSEDPSAL